MRRQPAQSDRRGPTSALGYGQHINEYIPKNTVTMASQQTRNLPSFWSRLTRHQ